jgi:hypothetical protein
VRRVCEGKGVALYSCALERARLAYPLAQRLAA